LQNTDRTVTLGCLDNQGVQITKVIRINDNVSMASKAVKEIDVFSCVSGITVVNF